MTHSKVTVSCWPWGECKLYEFSAVFHLSSEQVFVDEWVNGKAQMNTWGCELAILELMIQSGKPLVQIISCQIWLFNVELSMCFLSTSSIMHT